MRYILAVATFLLFLLSYNVKEAPVLWSEISHCQKLQAFLQLTQKHHVSQLLESPRFQASEFVPGIRKELAHILDPFKIVFTDSDLVNPLSVKFESGQLCEVLQNTIVQFKEGWKNSQLMIDDVLSENKSPQLASLLRHFPKDDIDIDFTKWPKYKSSQRYRLYYWLKQYMDENLDEGVSEAEALIVAKRQFRRAFNSMNVSQEILFERYSYKSLLQYFDAHSDYYPEEQFSSVRDQLKSSFVGLGVVVQESVKGYRIVSLVHGGPAKKQGVLKKGDVILRSDGQSLMGLGIEEIGQHLRGPMGSTTQLDIFRSGHYFSVLARRGAVRNIKSKVTSELTRVAGYRLGHIRLDQFYSRQNGLPGVMEDFFKHLIRLKMSDIDGLVIDLRGNLGGVLSEAVHIVGLFLESGPVVLEYGSSSKEVRFHSDMDGVSYFNKPVVVLVDESSASASEILSGSLQALNRAIVVGAEQTFGKGTIQSVGEVANILGEKVTNGGMKLTTGFYYLPNGHSVQYEGVKSQVVFNYLKESPQQIARLEKGQRNSLKQPPLLEVDLNDYKKWMGEEDYKKLTLYLRSQDMSREIVNANNKNKLQRAYSVLKDFIDFRNTPSLYAAVQKKK